MELAALLLLLWPDREAYSRHEYVIGTVGDVDFFFAFVLFGVRFLIFASDLAVSPVDEHHDENWDGSVEE